MKKILLFALPLLAMLSVSCEKDNGENNSGKTMLVKEIACDGETYFSFEYDTEGKVISVDIGIGLAYQVEYSDKTIKFDNGHHCSTCILDDNGYIVEIEDVYDYDENQHSFLEYKNGNLVKFYGDTYVWKNGDKYSNICDVEYSDIENITNIDFCSVLGDFPSIFYLKFKGMTSRHFIKADNDVECTYKYRLNDNGAPIQIIGTYSDGDKAIYTITYVD